MRSRWLIGRRPFVILLVLIVLLLVSGCRPSVGSSATVPANPQTPAVVRPVPPPTKDPAQGPASAQPTPAPGAAPAQGTYEGVPAGLTEDGYAYWGNPDAPVTMEEYTDYLCPFCARHVIETMPTLIEEYVKTGKVRYVFRDMPLVSLHPTAPRGHVATRCVAEQGPALFWRMHDELFKNQKQWSRLADPGDYLAGVAQELDVDMKAYEACLASGRQEGPLEQSIAAGQKLGFSGTPSFRFIQHQQDKAYTLVGALPVEVFSQWLDALLAGQEPPQQAQSEPAELPFWASAKGLAPDPQRPGFTTAGDPYKGNPQAKVAVVEFSNFQCSACKTHLLEVQPTLDKTFVDSGQILWVFKNLAPTSMPRAAAAAVAAECAGEQGKFWEMHDLLFATEDRWAVDEPGPVLRQLAEELGLDGEAFASCIEGQPARDRVAQDLSDAQGVTGDTPSFVVLFGGGGGLMKGSRPADQFVTILQGVLQEVNAASATPTAKP